MGQYIQFDSRKGTVKDALKAAEESHLLDCPNAELRLRLGAFILDAILAGLAFSGLEHLCLALQAHFLHLTVSATNTASLWQQLLFYLNQNAYLVSSSLFITFKASFAYLYFIWSLSFAGGSPGKLLLGLRVVNERTGEFPTLSQSLSRELIRLFGIAFLGITLYPVFQREDQRALHDLAGQSIVKRVHGRV